MEKQNKQIQNQDGDSDINTNVSIAKNSKKRKLQQFEAIRKLIRLSDITSLDDETAEKVADITNVVTSNKETDDVNIGFVVFSDDTREEVDDLGVMVGNIKCANIKLLSPVYPIHTQNMEELDMCHVVFIIDDRLQELKNMLPLEKQVVDLNSVHPTTLFIDISVSNISKYIKPLWTTYIHSLSHNDKASKQQMFTDLYRQLDQEDRHKELNNKTLARMFAVLENLTVVNGEGKNILYRYVDDKKNNNYGIWQRIENVDQLASMIDKMITSIGLKFTVSSTRAKIIIDEILCFDRDKFFIIDHNNDLLFQSNHSKYIRFNDVVVNRQGEKSEYRKEMFLTNKLPFNFPEKISDMDAIDYYFDSVFSDRSDSSRGEIKEYIQYKIGQAMFNDSSTQDCTILVGRGGSGKTTLSKLVAYMFNGDQFNSNVGSLDIESINSPRASFFLSSLWNKFINIVGEISEDTRLDSENMKKVLGEDYLTAEFKNKPMFSFVNKAQFWINSNHVPYIRDNNEASLRRFKIIRFNQTFISKPNLNLYEQMKREAPSFMRECINTYLENKVENHYPVPSECQRELQTILDSGDKIMGYFTDNIEITSNKEHMISRSDIYKDFVRWCRECGVREYSVNVFIDKIKNSSLYNSGSVGFRESTSSNGITRMYICNVRFRDHSSVAKLNDIIYDINVKKQKRENEDLARLI